MAAAAAIAGRPLPPYYGAGVGQSHLTLRCYSASYAQAWADVWGGNDGREGDGEGSNYGKSTSGSMAAWGVVADPEFQRKKRVASYKIYAVEGRSRVPLGRASGGSRTGTLRLFVVGDTMAFVVARARLEIPRLKFEGQELLV